MRPLRMGEVLPCPWHAPQVSTALDALPAANEPSIFAFMISIALVETSAVIRAQRSLRLVLEASMPVA